MLSLWRGRRRWPPPPFVEDELPSLAREVHGSISDPYESPGLEGVHCRGTVDQDPIILPVNMSITSRPASDSGTSSSGDSSGNSTTASTPESGSKKETVFPTPRNPGAEYYTEEQGENDSGTDLLRGQTSNHRTHPRLSQSSYDTWSRNKRRERSFSRPPSSYIRVERTRSSPHRAAPVDCESLFRRPSVVSHGQLPRRMQSKAPTSLDRKRGRSRSVKYGDSVDPLAANPKVQYTRVRPHTLSPKKILDRVDSTYADRKRGRSRSIKCNGSTERPVIGKKYTVTLASLPSRSAATGCRESRRLAGRNSQVGEKTSVQPPVAPTLAERLERKLRCRQELRDMKGIDLELPASASQSPARDSRSSSSARTYSSSTSSRSGTASSSTKLQQPLSNSLDKSQQSVPSSTSTSTQKPSQNSGLRKHISFKETQPGQSPRPRSQIMEPPRETNVRPAPTSKIKDRLDQSQLRSQSCQRNMPSLELARRPYSETENLCLLPCPRSIPMAGHRDWYTIQGMTYLDICPSCKEQISQSRFHDFFVPSASKPRGQKVRCSFSQPWIRLAWVQAIRKDHCDLKMLHQVTRPPATVEPCPGHAPSEQYWYRIVDPKTDMFLPRFSVCSACVRNLRILMPSHWNTFERSPTLRESICDFDTASPRFVQYIDHLDTAANHAKISGSPRDVRAVDLDGFLAYARRKVVLHDCQRDRLISSTWRYIPQLPEFTVCEDCYDDVVWPLCKAKYPIARMFSSSQQPLPGDDVRRCREASCQLYSPRMRVKFRDAVLRNDLVHLGNVALMRHNAERQFRARRRELLNDERQGYDRDVELRVNGEEWRKWE